MTRPAHTAVPETRDAVYNALYLGEVLRNDDPLGLGRIKVLVPGLLAPESTWAFPIGRMFGIKNGFWWVPEVGANVCVFLHQGKSRHPYYMAGPFGAPGGTSDVPEQAPGGSVDHMVIRWRDFHITLDGTDGAEKLTIQDLGSGTKIELDRTTGDYTRDIEGDETVTIAKDKTLTVETGDETRTITAGKRTTTIQGDDTKTLVAGNEVKTIGGNKVQTVAGNETKTIGGVAGSTESIPAGAKNVTAGLAINIIAGGAVNVTAGGAVSITGAGVSIAAGAGTTTQTGAGLITKTFLGGLISTLTGVWAETINGTMTWTLTALATLFGQLLRLGAGVDAATPPFTVGYRRLVTFDFFAAWANIHSHAGLGVVATQQIVPPTAPTQPIPDPLIVAPGIDERLFSTAHTEAS